MAARFSAVLFGSVRMQVGELVVVSLSESFYDEVNQHPIPVERHVVASLANAPGLLDFYL
jgi:hypothetical protein